MIIDGADNCAYDIFAATDEQFAMFFAEGEDIAFSEEIWAKPVRDGLAEAFGDLWTRPIEKRDVQGIHGTIFYKLENKKQYYPNRRNSDLDGWARGWFHVGNEDNDLRDVITNNQQDAD
jgi:hypothetical protein